MKDKMKMSMVDHENSYSRALERWRHNKRNRKCDPVYDVYIARRKRKIKEFLGEL